MPLQDYSHWNEEAAQVWYEEEGKHSIHHELYETEPEWDDVESTLWDERDEDECESETEEA